MVTQVVEWPIEAISIPDNQSFNSGKLVLTGDAAHAMVLYVALGAVMAVEDATAIAATLQHLNSPSMLSSCIFKFVEVRKPRTTLVQEASFGHGLILHLPDGPLQRVCDRAMEPEVKGKPVRESPNQWNDSVIADQLYRYNPETEIGKLWTIVIREQAQFNNREVFVEAGALALSSIHLQVKLVIDFLLVCQILSERRLLYINNDQVYKL